MTTDRFDAWSFCRNVLARGAAVQQDYAAGNHASYEVYAARLDAVARELADRLTPHLAANPADAVEPVTAAHLRAWPGWEDDPHVACSCRPVSAGLIVRVWLNTGGVEVYGPGYEIGVRLIDSGCTLGRLRDLVRALEGP